MEQTSVQKLARVLRVLVLIIFVCNVIAVVTMPSFVVIDGTFSATGEWFNRPQETWDSFVDLWQYDRGDALVWLLPAWLICLFNFRGLRGLFLATPLIGGICTAVILWQGKRVLDTILAGEPFSMKNAANLKRAAVCCFVISGAALVCLIWTFVFNRSIWPLLTNNALFIPIFLVCGLLFLVMSALFRQAAELKAENDLTI